MTNQFLYRRREFITLVGGAAVTWPFAARAQQGERMRRIGYLRAGPPPERELGAFLRGLAGHGYVQGRNFVLVTQWGDGNVVRLQELAVALVNTGVVIEGAVAVRALHAVTAIDHCCYAWNTLIDQPWKIMSIAHRDWAIVGHSL